MKRMFSVAFLVAICVGTQGLTAQAFNVEFSKSIQSSLRPFQEKTGNKIRSLTGYPLRSQSSRDQYTVPLERKQTLAINALEALLEKQRKEVEETEILINQLSRDKEGENLLTSEGKVTNTSDIVASIYSGFDYGFVSRSDGCKTDLIGGFDPSSKDESSESYAPPANFVSLGSQQFMRNLNALMGEYKDEEDISLSNTQKSLQKKLKSLSLDTDAIWERERSRGPIVAPWIIKIPYFGLCYFLDVVFKDRYVFSRFFLLETVARMPYFSYITMLHFYETLGFWRRSSDIKRIHFAEEWNEFHHLLIMESLGGDQAWWVRFMAQHSALLYFTGLTILWAVSPTMAYKFSELLETHAVDTYGQLLDENEEIMKKLPPSMAAIEYYSLGISDPLFGEYQTSSEQNGEIRKPGTKMRSLYDVFYAIKCDEGDHVSTMKACLDPEVSVLSPSLEKKFATAVALGATVGYFLNTGEMINMDDFMNVASFDSVELSELIDEETMSGTIINTIVDGVIAILAGLGNVPIGETQEELESVDAGLYGSFLILVKEYFTKILELLSNLRL